MSGLLRGVITYAPVVLLPLLSTSCGSGTEPPPPPRATKLILLAMPSATAATMVPLGAQPVVQTADAGGIAVPTPATVTADVVSGSGAVMAGGSATTDASGRAAFSGLTLGAVSGQVGVLTLRFTAPGLEPVTTDVELRCAVLPLAIGETVNRALMAGDCTFHDGAFKNIYEITTSQPVTAVQLTVDATFFSTLSVQGPNDGIYYHGRSSSNALDRYGFKALLAPGLNRVAVSAVIAGKGGNYSLNATAATEDITCELLEAVVTTPIITSQQLAADDCSSGSFLEDRLEVGLAPNASITASMTTGAFQPHLRLLNGITDEVVAEATASGSATLVFANGSAPKIFSLVLTSEASGSSGPYTLSLNVTNPPAVAATDLISSLSLPILGNSRRHREPSRRLQ